MARRLTAFVVLLILAGMPAAATACAFACLPGAAHAAHHHPGPDDHDHQPTAAGDGEAAQVTAMGAALHACGWSALQPAVLAAHARSDVPSDVSVAAAVVVSPGSTGLTLSIRRAPPGPVPLPSRAPLVLRI